MKILRTAAYFLCCALIAAGCSGHKTIIQSIEEAMHRVPIDEVKEAKLVYILNADCSSCIGEYLEFIKQYGSSNFTYSVEVMFEKKYSAILAHYEELTGLSEKHNIFEIPSEKSFPFGYGHSSVLVFADKEGTVIKQVF